MNAIRECSGTIGHQMSCVRKQVKQITSDPAGNRVPHECNPGMFRVVENLLMKIIERELAAGFLSSSLYSRYKEAKKISEEAKAAAPKTEDFKTLIPNLSSG